VTGAQCLLCGGETPVFEHPDGQGPAQFDLCGACNLVFAAAADRVARTMLTDRPLGTVDAVRGQLALEDDQ
jgi:hypothetical protein